MPTQGTYKLGQRVRHAKFGEGVVLQMEGEGAQEKAQINFKAAGLKWLMLAYAALEAL
jgi:DNA helicase-2/ATP-dependent DNA helicase PcrA